MENKGFEGRCQGQDRVRLSGPYLIPFLDATDNVALLPMLAEKPNGEARDRARELLDALDVAHRAGSMSSELLGGEH